MKERVRRNRVRIIKKIVGTLLLSIIFLGVSVAEPCRSYYIGFPSTPSCSFFNINGLADFGIICLFLIIAIILSVIIIWLFGVFEDD
jgi:protein-S-isoprenylcysteine O-methyltransferase Ste14